MTISHEEYARVAENWKSPLQPGSTERLHGHREAAKAIAEAIRALPPPMTTTNDAQAPAPNGGGVRGALSELIDRVHDFGTFAIDADDPIIAWDNSVVPALVAARASLASDASPRGEWPKDPETGLNDLSLGTLLRKTREEASPMGEAVARKLHDEFADLCKRHAIPLPVSYFIARLLTRFPAHPAPATVEMLREAAEAAFDFLGGVDGASEVRDKLLAAIAPATEGRKG